MQAENPSFYEKTKVFPYGMPELKLVGTAFDQMWAVC